jgi:hypothetical protein
MTCSPLKVREWNTERSGNSPKCSLTMILKEPSSCVHPHFQHLKWTSHIHPQTGCHQRRSVLATMSWPTSGRLRSMASRHCCPHVTMLLSPPPLLGSSLISRSSSTAARYASSALESAWMFSTVLRMTRVVDFLTRSALQRF